MAMNDPNSAASKRLGSRTSGSGCARPRHRSRRVSLVGRSERPMSTASAEARAQCAARLRILHSLSPFHERKGIRAIRIDAELLSERTSLGQLDRNEAKIAAVITFAHEAAAARA